MSTVFLRNEANLAAVIGTTKIACKIRQEQTGEFVLPNHVMAFEDPKSG